MDVQALPWYYLDNLDPAAETQQLQGEEWHHAREVLRMKKGESLILFDGKGSGVSGKIVESTPKEGVIGHMTDVSGTFVALRKYRLTIAFGPTKNRDRTEMALEKISELGVDDIHFLDCKHGERSRIKIDRVHKVLISAAKQSRKLLLPRVHNFVKPLELVETLQSRKPVPRIYCCHLDKSAKPFAHTYTPGADVVMLIGPEGGFAEKEIEGLRAAGIPLVTLSPHRLRVETAVIAACQSIHLLNASLSS